MSHDPSDILSPAARQQATAESRLLASRIVQAAGEIERDARYHERLDALECPACFYFRDGEFDSQTTRECTGCGQAFSSARLDPMHLCETCAETRQQCRRCGADLEEASTDLPAARMFGAFSELHLRSLPAIGSLIQWAYVAAPDAARELAERILADLDEYGLKAQVRTLRDRLARAPEFAAAHEPVLPRRADELAGESAGLLPDDTLTYILKSLRRYGFVLKDLGREVSRDSADARLQAWASAQADLAGRPELWDALAEAFGRAVASDQLIRAMLRQRQEQTLDLGSD